MAKAKSTPAARQQITLPRWIFCKKDTIIEKYTDIKDDLHQSLVLSPTEELNKKSYLIEGVAKRK